jgi:hypothetical protein
MKLLDIFIFFILVLLFLHIRKHRKISNDMEILVFEGGRKDKLEIMCEFKQPIVFQIDTTNENLINKCNYDSIEKLGHSGAHDMNFIKENGLSSFFENDFLRPSLTCFEKQHTTYSILLSGDSIYKYDISYRHYLLVTQGTVIVTLIPPENIPTKKDYYEMKFYHEEEIALEKTLPITLKTGDCLYIPPLWGYKTTFEEKTSVIEFNYKTWMNMIAFADYYSLHFLQKMNTKYRFSDIKDMKNNIKTQQLVL